ncbi:hypothetical protein [Mameliella sediminis]|uniref:hypothetical protein n=1 Tax=Mameliella sediminis TaxID=2836866 RepID=UPI001C46BECC|nr:hypothetical protein [Mameliella sediminis]MBV7395148.1 hypothetical protein [Mameliella sediminis]MBY6159656.1 hypothetical protein [Mameliella alba]MBY6168127.1 hypothetical protein [Mameliella alba]MBY6173148.1 hypothetical protein [Mameliella alba]
MIVELFLPAIGLMLITALVTRGVERLMPESLPGLALTAVVSALLVWGIASGGFALLYVMRDARVLALMEQTPATSTSHFLSLGASAALIWAPVLLLTVTTAPRRWKTAVW